MEFSTEHVSVWVFVSVMFIPKVYRDSELGSCSDSSVSEISCLFVFVMLPCV